MGLFGHIDRQLVFLANDAEAVRDNWHTSVRHVYRQTYPRQRPAIAEQNLEEEELRMS